MQAGDIDGVFNACIACFTLSQQYRVGLLLPEGVMIRLEISSHTVADPFPDVYNLAVHQGFYSFLSWLSLQGMHPVRNRMAQC